MDTETKLYTCDAGDLVIEFLNGGTVRLSNGIGDGQFPVSVGKNPPKGLRIAATVKGKFRILKYDCNARVSDSNLAFIKHNFDLIGDKWMPKSLFDLSGEFFVYIDSGSVYFKKIGA